MAIQAAQWPRSGGPAGHDPRTELGPRPELDPQNPNPNKNERLGPPENSIESPDFPTIPEPQEILPVDPGIPIPPGPGSPTENLPMSLDVPTERFQPDINPSAFSIFDEIAPEDILEPILPPRFPPPDIRYKRSPGQRIFYPVEFDGTNDYTLLDGGLSPVSDSKVGICSFWFKATSDGDYLEIFRSDLEDSSGQDGTLSIRRAASNKMQIIGNNSSGTGVLNSISSVTVTVSDGWTHVLIGWDLATSTITMHFDNVEDTSLTTSTITNDNIAYAGAGEGGDYAAMGATFNRPAGAPPDYTFDAAYGFQIAQFYLNVAETLDMTSAANRAKFITASGEPAHVGFDAKVPTGTSPVVFFDGPVSSWHLNRGTGGVFTENGEITEGTGSP